MITITLRDRDTRKTVATAHAEDHSTKLSRSNIAVSTSENLGLDRFAQYDIEVVESDEEGIRDKYDLRLFP
ncbi:hypothetical protein [Halomonas sp. NO4]|uniref:hypothetical protein n=1 Tax=Halomonas sp. NO4 TaxID=2484813 RepID=UPI0013D40067|nr:hypothetical protein [Halomonas sp. NO4]